MASRVLLLAVAFMATIALSEAVGCSSNSECPHSQCCGQPMYDVLNLVKSCQPYGLEGEACHGSLISANCDCVEGLECVEHTGVFSMFHTSKGICKKPGQGESGILSALFGKK